MKAPQVTRVDIEEELKAKERGECLLCRLQATHLFSEECIVTPAFKTLTLCKVCNNLYNSDWFDSCPICEIEIESEGEI